MPETRNAVNVDSADRAQDAWHALSIAEVLKQVNVSPETGLTDQEVQERLQKYGPNALTEAPRPSFLSLVIGQLKSFVILLLIAAALISALLGDWIEAGAILAIVILNAVLGVVQESRAEEALAALKKMAAPEAHILRNGQRISVPADQLVPGDVVFLEAGNYVPADLRLFEAANLKVEEAALTGESLPVQKYVADGLDKDIPLGDQTNSAFMGTLVSYGRGGGIVISTGMHTQLGKIAGMLQTGEQEETPLQKRLNELGKTLGWASLAICALVFLVGWLQGGNPLDMFMIAVSLAIAAVPEGLPAIVTISLALGMREMVNRHALIRRLASVETLGSATVICTDKTGTLTQNVMTVTRLWVDGQFVEVTGSGYAPEGQFMIDQKPVYLGDYPAVLSALWVGLLNNDARLEKQPNEKGEMQYRMVGDPTEGSLLVAAAKAGAVSHDMRSAYPRTDEIPFDSDRKRMLTVHAIMQPDQHDMSPIYDENQREWFAINVKGAPDIVLNLCSSGLRMNDQDTYAMDGAARQRILDANERMTGEAMRVLAVAYRLTPTVPEMSASQELEKDLIFVGLIGMIDPPRQEVPPALEKARQAGIRTLMITGDYLNTARAIGASIGLLKENRQALTGKQLSEMDDAALRKAVQETDVFARVSPEHKVRIVDALRANGDVVAMTGDGVNDAPAIKHADIGVSMGITGTDVAKETADMVLTDDNYASIVSAVEQGRVIYSNIRKFVYYLISCNLAEIAIIFLPTLLGKGSPLTAIQLLWLNLISDGAPALALGTEKGDPDIMRQAPRPPKEPIINRSMQIGVVLQTVAISAVTLTAFLLGKGHSQPHFAETMAFATLSFSELLRAYTSRSERYPLAKIGFFSNRWMNYAVLFSMALLLVVIYVPFLNPVFDTQPLGWQEWLIILPLLVVPSLVAEIYKTILTRQGNKKK
jgi:P-type Ca2+ transporter type 2C